MNNENIQRLYIFNPDHDLALDNYDVNYISPAAARQLSTDLAILPLWYSGPDNAVLCTSVYNLSFLNEMEKVFTGLPALLTDCETEYLPHIVPVPWGWNPSIRKRLLLLGIKADYMPSEQQLDKIRQKSHRLNAVHLLEELRPVNHTCGESYFFSDINEIKSFVENSKECILKAPISGSGKGLNWCKGKFSSHLFNWCSNIICKQGGVVAEPLYDKVLDFAMQFYTDKSGIVSFTGYSLFQTKATGAYEGNILGTDKYIVSQLTDYIDLNTLLLIRKKIENKLSGKLQGIFTGYFGVDMMICKFGNKPDYRVHPCVEINLRMNMGMVSRKIHDYFVCSSGKGIFRIEYFNSPEKVFLHNLRMRKKFPLKIENNRVVHGYLPLVPVTPVSQYLAWININ